MTEFPSRRIEATPTHKPEIWTTEESESTITHLYLTFEWAEAWLITINNITQANANLAKNRMSEIILQKLELHERQAMHEES